MKVKIRFKLEDPRGTGAMLPTRRIAIGKLKQFPENDYVPESIKKNFIFIEGKNFYVDHPRKIAETVEEETKEFLIPIKEVRSITVLPEDFCLDNIEYEIVGSRLICKTTREAVTIEEEGR